MSRLYLVERRGEAVSRITERYLRVRLKVYVSLQRQVIGRSATDIDAYLSSYMKAFIDRLLLTYPETSRTPLLRDHV